MSRRYELGTHPEYDASYSKFEATSRILHPDGPHGPANSELSTVTVLSDLIDEKKQKVVDIEVRFERMQEARRKSGDAPLTGLPSDLQRERLVLEARIDVLALELAAVQKVEKERQDREQAAAEAEILKFGPMCSGRLRDGVLAIIDGQPVISKRGTLRIACKSSPYDGMAVSDYKAMAAAWQKSRRRERRERMSFLEGKRKEKTATVAEVEELAQLSDPKALKRISRAALPPRPRGT